MSECREFFTTRGGGECLCNELKGHAGHHWGPRVNCPICSLHELADAIGPAGKAFVWSAFLLPLRGFLRCEAHTKRGRSWLRSKADWAASDLGPLLPGEPGWDHKANPLCEERWVAREGGLVECVLPERHPGGCKGYTVGSMHIRRIDEW